MLKKLVEKRLAYVSRQILEKYKPEVIAVTGSVGKTTTKEALTTVLRSAQPPKIIIMKLVCL